MDTTQLIEQQLPDFLSRFAFGLREGYSVRQLFDALGGELPEPLGAELKQVVADWQATQSWVAALDAWLVRVPSGSLNLILATLKVQMETGGNLADKLDLIAQIMRRMADVQQARERIVTAREEERRRLRRDLHDGLGPMLAVQILELDAALDALDSDPARTRAILLALKTHTRTTLSDIRRIVYELYPAALDQLGLVSAARELVERYNAGTNGLRFHFHTSAGVWPALSAAVEVAAYRILAEATANVVRHAQAQTCSVTLTHTAQALIVEVRDDGIGLSAEPVIGIGLNSMRDRATELGGQWIIEPIATGGTCVRATLPVTP